MQSIRPELLDQLLKDYQKPDDLLGQDGLLQQLSKALVERTLDGELTQHLGYERYDSADDNSGNSRNGTTPKTLRGKRGQVQIDVPGDRTSEFEPQLARKGQTRFDGLDENIISLYARGMTQREIQGNLEEIYDVEVSPSLISTVTDAVLDEVRARKVTKNRSLFPNDDAVFKLMYLALRNISQRWTMPIKNWSAALSQFAILFDGRVPMGGLNSNSLTQNV